MPTYVPRIFEVSWQGDDVGSAGIAHFDVQVRVDGGRWSDWLIGVTDKPAVYVGGENGRLYEFRARGVGNVEPFGGPEAATTADTRPPASRMDPLPALTGNDAFTVSWSGQDDVSGVKYYDVQRRFGLEPWALWQQQTLATSFDLTNAADGVYRFEARAVDQVGLVESFLDRAEASILVDAEPPFVTPRLWLPMVVSP